MQLMLEDERAYMSIEMMWQITVPLIYFFDNDSFKKRSLRYYWTSIQMRELSNDKIDEGYYYTLHEYDPPPYFIVSGPSSTSMSFIRDAVTQLAVEGSFVPILDDLDDQGQKRDQTVDLLD